MAKRIKKLVKGSVYHVVYATDAEFVARFSRVEGRDYHFFNILSYFDTKEACFIHTTLVFDGTEEIRLASKAEIKHLEIFERERRV